MADHDQMIMIPSPLRKRKNLLKKYKVFQKSNPLVRSFLLTEPRCKYETLGFDMDLACEISPKDIDYIFVLSGSIQVVCEQYLSFQNEFSQEPKAPLVNHDATFGSQVAHQTLIQ